MENVKIILDNGVELNVNGLFYIFGSKYYFMYTMGEVSEDEYVKLYVVQVCKEVQNTPTGPVDTGYMLGMEISNEEEWRKVQESITKIVDAKKIGVQSSDIQYLPINMLVNLKIVSKNKFKLMKHIVENNFNIIISAKNGTDIDNGSATGLINDLENNVSNDLNPPEINNNIDNFNTDIVDNKANLDNIEASSEVIIDYRARFFEEQDKNQALEEQIHILNEKLENIKNIIG